MRRRRTHLTIAEKGMARAFLEAGWSTIKVAQRLRVSR